MSVARHDKNKSAPWERNVRNILLPRSYKAKETTRATNMPPLTGLPKLLLRNFPNGLLNLPVPEFDLVLPAVDEALDDNPAGARPAKQLGRHLVVLPLVKHLQERAAQECPVADVEGERDERVELVLVERDLDARVDGLLG